MKKFINKVENVELEMLEGIAKAHPQQLKKLPDFNVLVRAEKKTDKVALVSGGGSGHEPAHGGFVGKGMLDAAVAALYSPPPHRIRSRPPFGKLPPRRVFCSSSKTTPAM